jgi:hypothetical protein
VATSVSRGNGPAQRAMVAAIHALEQELPTEAAAQEKVAGRSAPDQQLRSRAPDRVRAEARLPGKRRAAARDLAYSALILL